MARKTKAAVEVDATQADPTKLGSALAVASGVLEMPPAFTLLADDPLHMRCLLAVVLLLQNEAYGSELHLAAVAKLREFELYEEAHR